MNDKYADMWTNWWFEIVGEESELCGEQFFVAVKVPIEEAKAEAMKIAKENFPNEELICYGWVSDEEADMMGLDTY